MASTYTQAPSVAAPDAKPPVFLLDASFDPYSRQVYVGLSNRSLVTLDALVVDAQIESSNGSVENRKFMFKYVDPSKSAVDEASVGRFDKPQLGAVRAVTVCQVGGHYVDDCGAYLDGKLSGEVPVIVRLTH